MSTNEEKRAGPQVLVEPRRRARRGERKSGRSELFAIFVNHISSGSTPQKQHEKSVFLPQVC